MFKGFFLYLIFFCSQASAQILIIEVDELSPTLNHSEQSSDQLESVAQPIMNHAEEVSEIACRNLVEVCSLVFIEDFNQSEIDTFIVLLNKSLVANLSLAFQKPERKSTRRDSSTDESKSFETLLDEFKQRDEVVQTLLRNNPQTLFVTVAGNGYDLGVGWTKGIPLSQQFQIYPALNQAPNLIKVSSLNSDKINLEKLEDYSLADYANYSILHVDVAAPVELGKNGQELRGTSFAAPYVSRLAYEMRNQFPQLTAQELKEILIKSSYVIQIDRALEVTQDWLDQGDDSLIVRLEKVRKKKERERLIAEIGPIMMVKSGGPVVPEVAKLCAELYSDSLGEMTLSQSCLKAQELILAADATRQSKIEKLWKLRNI